MEMVSDLLAEILAGRALGGFTRSNLWHQFVPDERNPESLAAYADLRDIVRDAYELGWRRRAVEPTEIDRNLDASGETKAAPARKSSRDATC